MALVAPKACGHLLQLKNTVTLPATPRRSATTGRFGVLCSLSFFLTGFTPLFEGTEGKREKSHQRSVLFGGVEKPETLQVK